LDAQAAAAAASGGLLKPVALAVASIDTSDLRAFLMRPGPQGAMVQCYIQRRKTGMARIYPTYEIYLKEGDQFLLAARKRKKNKSSNYLISLDKDDLARQSGNFFGKLRSNFVGTEFQLYDKGINPEKADEGQKAGASSMVQVRQELGTVLYKQNVLGSRGPRKMKVMVPAVNEAGQRKVLKPMSDEETMLERYKAAENDEDVRILKNKPPKWNDQVGAYVLNFNGRVTRASVKNFQLCDLARDPDTVVMQFGRVGKDAFTMDFQYPLCALQAFGIALSSFDYKIACE
jgi:tubby-related protein 1